MKGSNQWSFRSYRPLHENIDENTLQIVRIAPKADSVDLEWIDLADSATKTPDYCVQYTLVGEDLSQEKIVNHKSILIENLSVKSEYSVTVLRLDENAHKSRQRLFRTGDVNGVVVNYLHPQDNSYSFSGQYLCSPSVIRLSSGLLLASMDLFDHGSAQNLTIIFRSVDGGHTWKHHAELFPCFWGKLFEHRASLYMLAVSTEYGDLLIGKSDDQGLNWSTPTVIARGSGNMRTPGHHRAPVTILVHQGRIWTACEYGTWNERFFASTLLSIDVDADLLDASQWILADLLRNDPLWEGAVEGVVGGIEGNLVVAPDGSLLNFLRYADHKVQVLKVDLSNPKNSQNFDSIRSFPLAHSKFEIMQHENGLYYAVGNQSPGRNILSLFVSDDLWSWQHHSDIVNASEYSIEEVGFQYPSFIFDGNDILVLSRTAWNQARNYHDSNYITLHRHRL